MQLLRRLGKLDLRLIGGLAAGCLFALYFHMAVEIIYECNRINFYIIITRALPLAYWSYGKEIRYLIAL